MEKSPQPLHETDQITPEVLSSDTLPPRDEAIDAVRSEINNLQAEIDEVEANAETPGFKANANEVLTAKLAKRDLAPKRERLEGLRQAWSQAGGDKIEEAESTVKDFNFKDTAADRVRGTLALRDAKNAFYAKLEEDFVKETEVSAEIPSSVDDSEFVSQAYDVGASLRDPEVIKKLQSNPEVAKSIQESLRNAQANFNEAPVPAPEKSAEPSSGLEEINVDDETAARKVQAELAARVQEINDADAKDTDTVADTQAGSTGRSIGPLVSGFDGGTLAANAEAKAKAKAERKESMFSDAMTGRELNYHDEVWVDDVPAVHKMPAGNDTDRQQDTTDNTVATTSVNSELLGINPKYKSDSNRLERLAEGIDLKNLKKAMKRAGEIFKFKGRERGSKGTKMALGAIAGIGLIVGGAFIAKAVTNNNSPEKVTAGTSATPNPSPSESQAKPTETAEKTDPTAEILKSDAWNIPKGSGGEALIQRLGVDKGVWYANEEEFVKEFPGEAFRMNDRHIGLANPGALSPNAIQFWANKAQQK